MPPLAMAHACALAPAHAGGGAYTSGRPPSRRCVPAALAAVLPLWLAVAAPAAAGPQAAADGAPPSDLSIDHIAGQPAGMVTCSYGYWAEKSGDHAIANAIFDRCIEAGYAGAMIWKALLYEEGNGVPQDSAKAAVLLRRAAESGDSGYATLGKLHYATALFLGKGVPRDEAAAMKWFRAAADEGSVEAREFLLTGRHTGDRDLLARAVGDQPWQVQGQRLAKSTAPAEPAAVARLGPWLFIGLGTVFLAGLVHQAGGTRRLQTAARRS